MEIEELFDKYNEELFSKIPMETEIIKVDGVPVGFLQFVGNHIANCFILKKFRRRGIMRNHFLTAHKKNNFKFLDIVYKNDVAQKFWNSFLELREVMRTDWYITYEIVGLKK